MKFCIIQYGYIFANNKAQIKKRLHVQMQQIYIREPEDNEFLEINHEEFKERARELEKKLFPSVR